MGRLRPERGSSRANAGPPAPLESLVPMENHMLQSCWVSAGDAAWPDARRDRIEQQIIRAYVRLIFADEAGGLPYRHA